MSGKTRYRHKVFGKNFVILPILFFVGISALLYAALSPTVGSLISAAEMFFSDSDKDYSSEYKNIFVPVQENDTVPTVTNPQSKKPEVPAKEVVYPNYSNQFAEISIPDCGVDSKLFFGDGDVALRNGVGVYNGSFIPGYGKTTLIAGHNNTYFNGLKNAKEGQEVFIRTSYGNYTYRITSTAIKDALDPTAYDLGADYENLVMYTCYPFDAIGLTDRRFFVYADLVDGMAIQKNAGEGQ